MAYACAIGTDKDVRPPHAMAVVAHLTKLGVPMGSLALEDLWRLPAESYKEYVVSSSAHAGVIKDIRIWSCDLGLGKGANGRRGQSCGVWA